ncbi:MAG: adenine phosphoribosyltransferase [Sandaracinaceae bacterium]|nr:adenine phosphoribosyltransferase [Sandaracinaceae bacterium]MDW8245914.1 adenine phosphoribosyltransferase [Sandaracinaceae bacterium]
MEDQSQKIRALIASVPDFPKPGVVFRDITPLLADPEAYRLAISLMRQSVEELRPQAIVAIESRGFLFGAPLALELGLPLVPVRKRGKLPRAVQRVEYALEYGTDALEMHRDVLRPGLRTLIVDDVLATGGTARATIELVRKEGGEPVGAAFLIELQALGGRRALEPVPVRSLVTF